MQCERVDGTEARRKGNEAQMTREFFVFCQIDLAFAMRRVRNIRSFHRVYSHSISRVDTMHTQCEWHQEQKE